MTRPRAVRREFWAATALGGLLLMAGRVAGKYAASKPHCAVGDAVCEARDSVLLSVGLGLLVLGVVMVVVAAVEWLLGVSRRGSPLDR